MPKCSPNTAGWISPSDPFSLHRRIDDLRSAVDGVPVVTRAGETLVSRQSASLLVGTSAKPNG